MKSKTNGSIQKVGEVDHAQSGPNWVVVAGGILIDTLSVRFGCKLKQIFDMKQRNGTSKVKRRTGACELHSNVYRFSGQTSCYCCISALADGLEVKQAAASSLSKSAEPSILPVKVPGPESSAENSGVMWTPPPYQLEDPPKPFQYSNSSGSPCFSESGSDIYSKRGHTEAEAAPQEM